MATSVDQMTLAQLKAEFKQLAAEIDVRANRRAEIKREVDARKLNAQAQSRVDRLTPRQREALKEVLCEA